MKLLITGASGYMGSILADQLLRHPDVDELLLIDKDPLSRLLEGHADANKLTFIQDNLANDAWKEKALAFAPDVVVHAAWQIRELYGNKEGQWRMNIGASDNLFDFVLSAPTVKKLIHFSTVASYGAFEENTLEHFFTEDEPFRRSDYKYAEEKRIVEEKLSEKYQNARKGSNRYIPQVVIIRPAAITGPRGRNIHIRFGLQSALAGTLKRERSWLYRAVAIFLKVVPVTPKWARQYIHEDDVTDIIAMLALAELKTDYEIFNIAPPGAPMLGKDMAEAVGKKKLMVLPWMIRTVFFFARHLTFGRIPTSRGVWKGYSYPILVDGSKLTIMYGFKYKFSPKEAFTQNEGRYASRA